ncbi:MAG TPA: hypothetical protein VLV49_15220 [Terriglobales bacterium]|nr:hypothetical protein [Terriglobales bacterium]
MCKATKKLIWVAAGLLAALAAQAQTEPPKADPSAADDAAVTMFPHSQSSRWWISGQGNIIFQWHPGYNRDRGPVIVPGLRVHMDF